MNELRESPGPAPDGPRAWLEISARLGDIGKGVNALVNDGRRAAMTAEPTRAVRRASGIVATGGPDLMLDLGGPSMGRMWSVRSLAVAPASGVTGTLAGSAYWYVGNPSVYGPGEWCAPAQTTLPAFNTVTRDSVDVHPTDHLFVVIHGGTAGQAAYARAVILDFPRYTGRPVVEL